jgi:hypothetical protein
MKIRAAMITMWKALGRRKIATMPANMLSPRHMVDLDVMFNASLMSTVCEKNQGRTLSESVHQ